MKAGELLAAMTFATVTFAGAALAAEGNGMAFTAGVLGVCAAITMLVTVGVMVAYPADDSDVRFTPGGGR